MIERAFQKVDIYRLGYIDLLLLENPGSRPELRRASWAALMEAQKRGWAKSIGVSNFDVTHLQEFLDMGYKPVINQIDIHPFNTRTELVEFCRKHDIVVQVTSLLSDLTRRTHHWCMVK
jgi:diketogulonate reductase-like aldo/keto reductase